MLQVLRRNTQRRVTPKGYPYFPSQNDMLMGRNARTSKTKYERHASSAQVWRYESCDAKASRATKMELDDMWLVSIFVVN